MESRERVVVQRREHESVYTTSENPLFRVEDLNTLPLNMDIKSYKGVTTLNTFPHLFLVALAIRIVS